MKTLLVHPPFASPFSPYISVAALCAHLKARGLPVAVLDANNLLLRQLLSPSNLASAHALAVERLQQWNASPALDFSEASAFCLLAEALANHARFGHRYGELLDPAADMHPKVRMALAAKALQLASCAHFPEFLDISGSMIHFLSPYSDYASQDVIQAAENLTIFQPHLGRIVKEALERERPGIVGISVSFPDQMAGAMRCAKHVKELAPETLVIMGGSFLSCHARSTRETDLFRWVDGFVLDDGEIALEKIIRQHGAGALDWASIPGAMYLEGGAIIRNEPAPSLDFAQTPPPDYTAFDLDAYFVPRQSLMLPLRLSRGCKWGRCAFCRTELPMIGHYSEGRGEEVFHKVRSVAEATGTNWFIFSDDSAAPEELETFSRLVQEHKLHWNWVTSIRFDPRITIERAQLYRAAGCRMFTLGLEAYNDRLLQLVRKGSTVELINRVLSNFSWAGMPASAYMILGLPTETLEEAAASHAALAAKRDAGQVELLIYSPFQIVTHSPIGSNPEAFGVTSMTVPEGLDLDPPIFDFESTGMSRAEMLQFAMEKHLFFSALLAKSASQFTALTQHSGHNEALAGILADGLRYAPARLQAHIQAHSKNTVTYGRWLAETTAATAPLRPDNG